MSESNEGGAAGGGGGGGSSSSKTKSAKVAYFYDSEIGNFHYGLGHPMKPQRVRMTHDLIINYELYSKMSVFRPRLLGQADLCKFHDKDYIQFLKTITPGNMHENVDALKMFAVGEDCPIFDGIYEFSQICSSGSVGGAVRLNSVSQTLSSTGAEVCIMPKA